MQSKHNSVLEFTGTNRLSNPAWNKNIVYQCSAFAQMASMKSPSQDIYPRSCTLRLNPELQGKVKFLTTWPFLHSCWASLVLNLIYICKNANKTSLILCYNLFLFSVIFNYEAFNQGVISCYIRPLLNKLNSYWLTNNQGKMIGHRGK